MIQFESFSLDNGLQVVVHQDQHSLVAAVNIMYNVGSRDEDPHKTGLAHLCEHLMFSGSQHIDSYDGPLQEVGGNNNAYTSSDVTSYHCTLPATNLETAFWLESDRMLGLTLAADSLAVQKKVVIEEFKEVYLNQPYGDAWNQLCQLAYQQHPYQWPVIGKSISHIESITREDVQAFFKQFYTPNNAVLVVAGAVDKEQVEILAKKWFGDLQPVSMLKKNFAFEPFHKGALHSTLKRKVPLDALYKAYLIPGIHHPAYPSMELFCTAIGTGKSAPLYQKLVEELGYFNSIETYTTHTIDPGLLVVAGRVNPSIQIEVAEEALSNLIETGCLESLTMNELEKAKNHLEADFFYETMDIAYRAEALAMATLLGDTARVNTQLNNLLHTTLATVHADVEPLIKKENSMTLYYQRVE